MTMPGSSHVGRRVPSAAARALALLGLCVLGQIACTTTPKARESRDCSGDRVVAVRNEAGYWVEVYLIDGSIQRILGTAGPGRTELTLPPGAEGYFQARRQGARSGTGWLRRRGSRVSFDVECR
jgi:hypothetical protein